MLTLIANVLSVSEALFKIHLRSYSKALIINLTNCNSTTWNVSNECLLKSSATTHAQLLTFLHYSQGSYFFFLFAPLGHVELFVRLIHVYT